MESLKYKHKKNPVAHRGIVPGLPESYNSLGLDITKIGKNLL